MRGSGQLYGVMRGLVFQALQIAFACKQELCKTRTPRSVDQLISRAAQFVSIASRLHKLSPASWCQK